MAGMRSRHRMNCNAGRRKSAKFPHCRFTIRRPPEKYKRAIKCPRCGSLEVVSVEHSYRKYEATRTKCNCLAVPFTHRKGSHRWCEYHPLRDVPLTEDEEHHRDAVMNNPTRTTDR